MTKLSGTRKGGGWEASGGKVPGFLIAGKKERMLA